MIGLSLSFCIQDIINGVVRFEDVDRLVCGTKFKDAHALESVIDSYTIGYSYENPELGRSLARLFYCQGKIEQPRLNGEAPYAVYASVGHWVADDEALALHPKAW